MSYRFNNLNTPTPPTLQEMMDGVWVIPYRPTSLPIPDDVLDGPEGLYGWMVRNRVPTVLFYGERIIDVPSVPLQAYSDVPISYVTADYIASSLDPRLESGDLDGRAIIITIHIRLLRSGDVELNPGPFIATVASVLFLTALINYKAIIPSSLDMIDDLIRMTHFGAVLADCELSYLDVRTTIRNNNLWYMDFTEPEHLSTVCRFARDYYPRFHVLPLPDLPPIPLYKLLTLLLNLSLFSFYSGFLLCIFATYLLYRKLRGYQAIRVINDSKGFDVNGLKDCFKHYMSSDAYPRYVEGEHRRLAYQRKFVEKFAVEQLLDKFERFRDIGGSRTRWCEYAGRKHLCAFSMDAMDILRDEKSSGYFESCDSPGQNCPVRKDILAAILTHSDYYITPEELSEIITGPTFIINHDFENDRNLGAYMYTEVVGKKVVEKYKYECVANVGAGLVHMLPQGGTPYGPHPYNKWQSEGAIVGQNGACVYVRIGKYKDTCLYYAYPSCGEYDVVSRYNLARSTNATRHYIGRTELYFHPDKYVYGDYELPREIGDSVSHSMATVPRDVKYMPVLINLVSAKLRAAERNEASLNIAVLICSYLADHRSLDLPNSVLSGNPCEYGLIKRYVSKLKLHLWAPWIVGKKCADNVSKLTPWDFRRKYVAVYQKFTRLNAVRLTGRAVLKPFLAEVSAPDAFGDQAPEHDSSSDDSEYDYESGDESVESCRSYSSVPSQLGVDTLNHVLPPTELEPGPPCEVPPSGEQSEGECDTGEPNDMASRGARVIAIDVDDARQGVVINWDGELHTVRVDEAVQKILPHAIKVDCSEFVGFTQQVVSKLYECKPVELDWSALQLLWYHAFYYSKSPISFVRMGCNFRSYTLAEGVRPGTFTFRHMGYEISAETPNATQEGVRQSRQPFHNKKGRCRQKFPKNRNIH